MGSDSDSVREENVRLRKKEDTAPKPTIRDINVHKNITGDTGALYIIALVLIVFFISYFVFGPKK